MNALLLPASMVATVWMGIMVTSASVLRCTPAQIVRVRGGRAMVNHAATTPPVLSAQTSDHIHVPVHLVLPGKCHYDLICCTLSDTNICDCLDEDIYLSNLVR